MNFKLRDQQFKSILCLYVSVCVYICTHTYTYTLRNENILTATQKPVRYTCKNEKMNPSTALKRIIKSQEKKTKGRGKKKDL